MKIIGIIGGMGPLATSKLYLKLTDACKIERPEIIIDSVQMNLDFERNIIHGNADIAIFNRIIQKSISRLTNVGATIILIPCNTAHSVFGDKSPMNLEILSMIGVTLKRIAKNNPKTVALLATKTTLDSNMYQFELNKLGILSYIPNTTEQQTIEDEINNVLYGNHTPKNPEKLELLIDNISKKSDLILLACTELSEIIETKNNIIDSLSCLTEAAINIVSD